MLGEGIGRGELVGGGGVGFCRLCSELPPRTSTSLGTENSHSALTPESPLAAKRLQEGRTPEELTAEDALFLGAGLARVRGVRSRVLAKKAGGKEHGSQMDPHIAPA